ncbi:type VI secretion protein [Methylosinus sp. R-45379]|uniref:type VI secretion system baseplate subunit TssF n=1 Tax=Methylosinus sp. R-45379 TaxID=980563 RepID=UPI0007C8BA02|nr:type VI secretion system baseplate subunit TssF [Methylosinus sp. R-45379]OAI25833.1 type VI secretion protein [Methylosinus sp. R-45379]
MNREFLDLYDRELDLLYEHGREFAEEYPGVASRLGGLARDSMDPSISGLFEGSAFLAARVQLKLKHEFPEFINNLLEQLVPNFLAPTPSIFLAQIRPPFGDPALKEGRVIARGASVDAGYVEREREVSCRYKLTAPVELWPFEIAAAEYCQTAAPLAALGVKPGPETVAGMKLTLSMRSAVEPRESNGAAQDIFSSCPVEHLPIHLCGAEAESVGLYEQLFAHCTGVWLRCVDETGEPIVISLGREAIGEIGFGDDEELIPSDDRIFRGFELLREYFTFPQKFLGFDLRGLRRALARMPASSISVIFGFDEINSQLPAAVRPQMFSLFSAPAVNLFEMTTDRIRIRKNQHEHQILPDRSKPLDFEPYRVLDVVAYMSGGGEKRPVRPLYTAAADDASSSDLSYTIRRCPRRHSEDERRRGVAFNYTGSDVFISISEPASLTTESEIAELGVRALCSNRHLPEHLPVGTGKADFRLTDDMSLDVVCAAGPTAPRDAVVSQIKSRTESAHSGVVAWRLLNMLSLNYLGLSEHGGGKNALALREMLATFADAVDSSIEKRLRGIKSVESRQIVRRLRRARGVGTALGVEITLTVDDKAFEGSGAFLLGAVLDRFFPAYAGMNSFTQLVMRTSERGVIMRWPARIGSRRLM